MENVLLVAYLLIVIALIAVILLQRSEGGGLGIGGNAGGLMTVRGSANLLTRTTGVLAALFFATAIGLTILAELDRGTDSILDQAAGPTGAQPSTVLDALSQMQGDTTSSAPAAATSSSAPATDPGLALPTTPAPSTAPTSSSGAAPTPSSSAQPPAPSSAPAQ
jgi:preprotein translocase subunit SecG